MKIALSFPGCHKRGGVERLILESANFLARKGHEVHVIAHDFDDEALERSVRWHPVPVFKKPALLRMAIYVRQCPQILADIGADASGTFGVICPGGGVFNVQSVHAAWLESSKRIRNLQGRLRQAFNPVHPFLLAMERRHFAERNYRKLIAPTEQVKADLMRIYGVPDSDVVIMPNGYCNETLNFARGKAVRPAMRQNLGLTDDDFAVVFVGNELDRKGFGPLMRAIAKLANPRIHLVAVVGRVSVSGAQAEARRLGLADRVHFTGAKNDVAPYYAAGDVLALPTQYEAWGLVIVEALACGTPVLTSRLAGAASTVKEGRTGELLDDPLDVQEIADKLEAILKRTRQTNRANVSKSVEHLTWECTLKKYEAILTACYTNSQK